MLHLLHFEVQAAPLSISPVNSDKGLPARSVHWTDSSGQPRIAIMVDQRQGGAGYLRSLTYVFNGANRVCIGTGENGHMGDGYVQNHTAFGGDSSSHGVAGTTTFPLVGTHHAIISYNMPGYRIGGQAVPTTVQWFFADGRPHPIFALSQDARGTAGNLGADSRSPYGDMAYDGGAGVVVGGASFGDTYKFTTLAANPERVTRNSAWRYDEPNTIPYAMQWSDPAQLDAEMGHVATVPILVRDAGSDPRTFPTVDVRGTKALNGPMIDDENWSFQILNYVLPDDGTPTWSKRLTWGTQWGFPGGFNNYGDNSLNIRQFSKHATSQNGAYNGTRADGMLMAYSVFVVFGPHAGGYKDGTVGQVVKQMENSAFAKLSAVLGSVKTSGPYGIGNAANETVSYSPAGYNPIFATWELTCENNAVEATLSPLAGQSIDQPIFVVNGYTAANLPASISLGNDLATPEIDYFASLDAPNQKLWITINRSSAAPITLKIGGEGILPHPPVIDEIPASGEVGTSIRVIGKNFNGATTVRFNGVSAMFTIESSTEILATVPSGATSGPISVTTPNGTGSSIGDFTPLTAPVGQFTAIYSDELHNAEDWSWATVDMTNPSPVHSGTKSIKVTAGAYEAIRVHFNAPVSTLNETALSFWLHGGATGGQPLILQATIDEQALAGVVLPPPPANTWLKYSIPFEELSLRDHHFFDGFWIQNNSGQVIGTFYLDDMDLVGTMPPSPPTILSINPSQALAGASITITGSNFSHVSDVKFNGANAAFVVQSITEITTTVPDEAADGPITVTTMGGTATSTTFTVLFPTPPKPSPFKQMDTDDGGWFTGFAIHPSGRLYGRTDVGGLYRSDDHGDSWQYLSGDMTRISTLSVQGVAVADDDANLVYQCVGVSYAEPTDQGIWKSTDGGKTWRLVKTGLLFSGNDAERWGGECIALRPGKQNEIWAGSRGNGLWRSTDGGQIWTESGTFPGLQFTSISLPPVGRSDIWVGSSGFSGPGGVWVSVNEGATWTKMSGLQHGVAAPAGVWRIVRQPNGKVLVAGGNETLGSVLYEFDAANWNSPAGYTWKDISWPNMDREQAAPLIAALADGRIVAGSIFGGYNGGPDSLRTQIRSLAGAWTPIDALTGPMPTWQRLQAPTIIEGGRNALMQDPSNPVRWFMAGGYGPFRTSDNGATWQYIVNGIDEVVAFKVNFHPTDPKQVYIPMADHAGAMVVDGGNSGVVYSYKSTPKKYPDDLALCHAILASGDRLLALGWDERALPGENDAYRPRIFQSLNNGISWNVMSPNGLPNEPNRCIISAVASPDNGDDILLAVGGEDNGLQGGVYRSTDGGNTFTRTLGLPVGSEYGDQWTPNADLDIDASDLSVRYLFLNNHGLYKSSNRGANWNFVNTGLPNYGVVAADRSQGGRLWIGTCCDQPIALSRSIDGGVSWLTVEGFTSVMDVDAAGDQVAVIGQREGDSFNKIYYSEDGSATWTEITRTGYRFGNAHAIAVDPWRSGTLWISTNGRSVARYSVGDESVPTPAFTIEQARISANGEYELVFTTRHDHGYRVEATEDLRIWTILRSYSNVTGEVIFSDTTSRNFQGRFYRVIELTP